MDCIYLLGLLVLILSLISLVLVHVVDCDFITFFHSKLGKQPAEFNGKVVWLTGASSGIGEAIAKELAKVGAKLVLSARRKEELERVKKECLECGFDLKEDDILVLPTDVTNTKSHETLLKIILNHFGALDIFISNAGQIQQGEFVDMDLEVDKHIFDINVFSIVNMNRLVVKYFLGNGGGQVAVVSSLAAKGALPLSSAYCASKHAINGYFHTLKMETYGKNIGVSIICPGPIDTPIFSKVVTKIPAEPENKPAPKVFPFMTAERCAYLSLVSIANQLTETWMARCPVIPLTYMRAYFPLLFDLTFRLVGRKALEQVREDFLAKGQ